MGDFTTEGSAHIYLTDFLITAPGNLPKLELMISGGEQKNKYINFIFVITNSHQVSAFALHFDIKNNVSRHTSRISFLTLCYTTLVAKTGRLKTTYRSAAHWPCFPFEVTLESCNLVVT